MLTHSNIMLTNNNITLTYRNIMLTNSIIGLTNGIIGLTGSIGVFCLSRFLAPREEQREGSHTWLSFGTLHHLSDLSQFSTGS